MDFTRLRKASLRLFIGFLALTALIAIVTVLSGSFGDLQIKVILTTLTISAASICSMSCAAFIEKRNKIHLGMTGVGLSGAGAILLIVGLWPPIDSDLYWKGTFAISVTAVAFAHVFLLLLPDLDARHGWVSKVTVVSIGILAVQVILAAWGEVQDEGYYRVLAVVAIAVALGTLVIPILAKLSRGGFGRGAQLVLEKIGDERYRDSTGKEYRVRVVEPEG